MQPLITRRRSRRRPVSGRVFTYLAMLAVIAVLVGGFLEVGRQSGRYDNSAYRSLAAQASAVADASNATATEVRSIMAVMQSNDRRTLQADLDSVVQQASDQATGAGMLATPRTPRNLGGQLAEVFAARARAVSQLRSALDGLLGMHPLPVAGGSHSGSTDAAAPTLLTFMQATNRITAAGQLLARSDQEYEGVRHDLAGSAAHAKIPSSVWITNAAVWQIGSVATQVDLVASSTSLSATHRLVLRTVRLTPQALPAVNGTVPPNVSVLSPTSKVEVSVVLANLGTVDEPHASVTFALTRQTTGKTVLQTRTTSLAAAGSLTLPGVIFTVKPGHTYQLTVSVVLPSNEPSGVGSTLTKLLQIAPAT